MLIKKRNQRKATTAVEFAVISLVAFMFLFAIFEYSRFVYVLQVSENAAREGTRYAIVRTGDGTTAQNVKDEVTRYMAGAEGLLDGYQVEVLSLDPSTGDPTGNNWNDAGFGQSIAVRITGTFTPVLPGFIMDNTVPVRITHMMNSEAN